MSVLDYLDTSNDTTDVSAVTFSPVTFTEPGVYRFTVRELTPSGENWTTDSRVYPVIVTVTTDGAGYLVAAVSYPEGKPTFVNTYKPIRPVKVCLQSKKVVCGTCLGESTFEFKVFDQCGIIVAKARNDQNGDVNFPALCFNRPGMYTYTIREAVPPSRDWAMDTRRYPVVIKVMECGGKLLATVSYPEGFPVFVNQYEPKCNTTCTPCSCKSDCLPCRESARCKEWC